jgi:hypothetical protein
VSWCFVSFMPFILGCGIVFGVLGLLHTYILGIEVAKLPMAFF